MAREDEIRKLAHRIWETVGRPEGHADDHWLEAERQLAAREAAVATAAPAAPAKPPAHRTGRRKSVT